MYDVDKRDVVPEYAPHDVRNDAESDAEMMRRNFLAVILGVIFGSISAPNLGFWRLEVVAHMHIYFGQAFRTAFRTRVRTCLLEAISCWLVVLACVTDAIMVGTCALQHGNSNHKDDTQQRQVRANPDWHSAM